MRSPSARSPVVLLLAAVSALAAACGGRDSPQEVVRDYVTTNDPAKCRLLVPELLERQTGRKGADGIRFCEANVRREQPPRDVRIVESEILGGRAQVELVVDQAEERVELIKRDGEWRISAFPR